jgi:DNA repair protein RadD
MILHPHQVDLVDRVRNAFRDHRAVLMQGATGLGKTAIASDIIRRAVGRGRRVIFAAHLDSLISDTSDRLSRAGIDHGILQADRPSNPDAAVQVASLATLHRRPECRPAADFIVIDECRRAGAPTVRAILDAYPTARLLGLDATPERADGTPLGDIFTSLVCGPSVAWLTDRGYLVPAIVLSPPAPTEGTLALDPVEALERHAQGRRAIVFCSDVAHATDVAGRLAGSALITGTTPRADRERARQGIASGTVRAIVNVGVYRDGADLPSLECVVLATTMGVLSAYLQAVGRGLRAAPGKRDCLVLDLVGAAILHGLPEDDRVWSLEGAACRRTAEALTPLCRCKVCLAVFHAGPARCPRCGAPTMGTTVARRATRVERQELARLDTRPAAERDAMAIRGIEKKLLKSGRFPVFKIPAIARAIFERNKKRAPEAA